MADTAVAITAGAGTNIDTRTESTNSNHRQVIVIGDPATNAGVAPVDVVKGLAVDLTASGALPTVTNLSQLGGAAVAMGTGVRSAGTQRVTVATDDLVPVTGTLTAVTAISNALPAGTNLLGKVDVQLAGTTPDVGSGTGGSKTQRVIVDTSQLATLLTSQGAFAAGAQQVSLPTDMAWPKGQSNRAFSVAFATLTRPANTTAYTAADSISDNATAGSVTALVSGNISDTNNDPIFINEIVINSTDTGLAGKKIRAYLYNSDPTASTGVGGGDNATFANKKAGYLGSFMGWMETGFSDGTVGRLVPCFNETNNTQAGGFIVVPPVSGARTLYIQYQAVEAFTPSANSTTIIGTARGWQGRAA